MQRLGWLLALVAVGCWDGGDTIPGDGALDPQWRAENDRVRLSATGPDDRLAVIGLPGALPEGAAWRIVEEGSGRELAHGAASLDGSFATWIEATGPRPMLRPLKADGGRGPDLPLARPAGPAMRPVGAALVVPLGSADGVRVRGLVGAAAAGATVVIGALDGGASEAVAAPGGDFEAAIAGVGGRFLAFEMPGDGFSGQDLPQSRSDQASHAVEWTGQPGDFPVLISAARAVPGGVVFLGREADLPGGPDAITVTRGETSVPVATLLRDGGGLFGGCADGLTAGERLTVTATGAGGPWHTTRAIPTDVSLVKLLNPSITASVVGDKVTIKGVAPAAVGQVLALNCATGGWTRATAAADGAVTLLLTAAPGDLVGLVAIGRQGELGEAQFLVGGTTSEVTLPVEPPDEALIGISASTDGAVVVTGTRDAVGGALLPYAGLAVEVPPATVERWPAGPFGEFAGLLSGVPVGGKVSLAQVFEPFQSEPLPLAVLAWSADLPRPPVPGLISARVVAGGMIEVSVEPFGLPDADVVLANLDAAAASREVAVDGAQAHTFTVPGAAGDRLALYPVEEGAQQGSRHVLRIARPFDMPYLVSAEGPLGCAAGLPGSPNEDLTANLWDPLGQSVGTAALSTPQSGGFLAVWEPDLSAPVASVALSMGDGDPTARPVTAPEGTDLSKLDLVATPSGLIVGSGATGIGPDWLVVLATAAGQIALLRPKTPAPWTLEASLGTAGSATELTVYAFGWHIPSGRASGCVERVLAVEIPDAPTITAVAPEPLALGKVFSVSGAHLAGATVTIGGVAQGITATDSVQLAGEVADDTPLGVQSLVVTTLGGLAATSVTVVEGPTILGVAPQPLVVGKLATVTGAAFGAAPTAQLDQLALELETAGDSALSFVVPPTVSPGVHNLRVQSEVGIDTATVEVVCVAPALGDVPATASVGQPLVVLGDHLLGATVTLGGLTQPLSEVLDNRLTIAVVAATPLGLGTLSVTTGCGVATAAVTVVSSAPVIAEVVPQPAVVGQPLNVYGDFLDGAAVTLGGAAQGLTIDSKKGLGFVVSVATALGEQTLTVTTPGGQTSAAVTVLAPPTITQVTPDPVTAGATLNVLGEHLSGAKAVIGGVAAATVSNTETFLQVTVDPDTPAGPQEVTVSTAAGSVSHPVGVVAAPVITLTLPDPASSGQALTILGKNFIDPVVTLGGLAHPLVSAEPTALKVIVDPALPVGEHTLTVVAGGGQVSTPISVVIGPSLATVTPDPLIVGGPFSLSGEKLAPGTLVSIGGVLQSVSSASPTAVSGVVSVGTPLGAQFLTLKSSAGAAALEVTVVGPPKISGLAPDPATTTEELVILGTGLGASTVTIGGVAAEIVSQSDDKLVVIVPAETPPGAQTVTVTNAAGQGSGSVVVTALPPTIDTVAPAPLFVDEPMTITGEFLHGAAVTVGGFDVDVSSTAFDEVVGMLHPSTPFGTVQLVLTTASGSVSRAVTVSDGTPPGPPAIASVVPEAGEAKDPITISGTNLKGAVVTIGGVTQKVLVGTNNTLVIELVAGTPAGAQTLTVTTAKGTAEVSFTVTTPAPQITAVAPNPVQATQNLTVTGKNLADFTLVTLGGVTQNVFYAVTPSKLVMKVLAVTPSGAGLPLVITTPGGQAQVAVTVTPAPLVAPEIFGVTPSEVHRGDTVSVAGAGLAGAAFDIGGVAHVPLSGSSDFLAVLTVAPETPAGQQWVTATKAGAPPAQAELFVFPDAPVDALVYASALGTADQAVLVGLPGAVEAKALVNLMVGGSLLTVVAQDDGSFSEVLEGLMDGDLLSMTQVVGGALSDPISRTLTLPLAAAPPTPHQFLMRVEQVGDEVWVYGPAPAFGSDESLILAATEGRAGFETAAALHADPTHGIALATSGQLGAPVTVFAAGPDPSEPASAPVLTFAVAYDPPMLTSALVGGVVCMAALPGSVSASIADLAVETDSGAPVPLAGLVTKPLLPTGSMAARATLAAPAPPGPYRWTGTASPHAFDLVIPTLVSPPLSVSQFTITPTATGLTVSATGQAPDSLLMVASPEGAAGAAFVGASGQASVTLSTTSKSLWVWRVALLGGSTTPCLELIAP